jgi:hypothetical protein
VVDVDDAVDADVSEMIAITLGMIRTFGSTFKACAVVTPSSDDG